MLLALSAVSNSTTYASTICNSTTYDSAISNSAITTYLPSPSSPRVWKIKDAKSLLNFILSLIGLYLILWWPEWSQAVVDPWVALVARLAGGPLCWHSRKDFWHMVSNCQQSTKCFKPRFWPGRFPLYIFPSFFLPPSWLPGQFTTCSSFQLIPGFVPHPRLP